MGLREWWLWLTYRRKAASARCLECDSIFLRANGVHLPGVPHPACCLTCAHRAAWRWKRAPVCTTPGAGDDREHPVSEQRIVDTSPGRTSTYLKAPRAAERVTLAALPDARGNGRGYVTRPNGQVTTALRKLGGVRDGVGNGPHDDSLDRAGYGCDFRRASSVPPRPDPTAHLRDKDIDTLCRDLDAVRDAVLADRGEQDAAYIRRLIHLRLGLELGGRVVLIGSRWRPAWVLGTSAVTLAKVLDSMEIGHNVLHGQWDWMRDPAIHSSTYEWDYTSPPEQWKKAHNETHHAFTNILGKDNDLGYGILRVDEAQEWRPRHLLQPLLNLVNACAFEQGIALYDLGFGDAVRSGEGFSADLRHRAGVTARRAGRQLAKDYVVWPVLSGRSWRSTLLANAVANLVRNVWSHSVIMCGHFPEGVETFELDELPVEESRGRWYLRQMLGSANVSGPPWLHVLTGNLSHQIEHHLFPDLPSNRYGQIAPQVREIFARNGLRYHSASLPRQVYSAWHKVVRLSVPPRSVAVSSR